MWRWLTASGGSRGPRLLVKFETNRPTAPAVTDALADLAAAMECTRSTYLRGVIGLLGEALQSG